MPGRSFSEIHMTTEEEKSAGRKWTPLALGFRPFFLLSIGFAILLMLLSLGGFSAGIWQQNYFDLPLWHAHEMVFGYAVAVIAGFLLTSVRNWTGLPTPTDISLGVLVLLWLLPRLLSAATLIPPFAYALLDLLFLPVLAVVLARLLIKARQPQHYPIPLLLVSLALCNTALHAQVLGLLEPLSTRRILEVSVCLIIALLSLIAGRVIPFFMQGSIGSRPVANSVIEKLALPSILLFAVSVAIGQAWLIISIALIAAAVHGIRLFGWFDRAIMREPMIWVLHAGYAWLVAGLITYAFAAWQQTTTAQAIHAWTVGCIGMFTLGMMARVALGHTGRPVRPLPWIPTAFLLLFIAASIRVLLPLMRPDLMATAVLISGVCWSSAFVIIGLRYTFILLQARVDGKTG